MRYGDFLAAPNSHTHRFTTGDGPAAMEGAAGLHLPSLTRWAFGLLRKSERAPFYRALYRVRDRAIFAHGNNGRVSRMAKLSPWITRPTHSWGEDVIYFMPIEEKTVRNAPQIYAVKYQISALSIWRDISAHADFCIGVAVLGMSPKA